MRNLDDLQNALSDVIGEAAQAAADKAQVDAVVQAAATGGLDAAREVASQMSTEDLLRAQDRLSP